jgi:hypothetical protein
MNLKRSDSYRRLRLMTMCTCLMLLISACNNSSSTSGLTSYMRTSVQKGNSLMQNSANGVAVFPHAHTTSSSGKPGTPVPTATPTGSTTYTKSNPGTPPGPVASGTGSDPASLPHYFSFGVINDPGTASFLDGQRSQNGTAYAFRYQYLTGGVNTGKGWEQWIKPGYLGEYAVSYMQESAAHGYIPAFVYYELCLSNGPHPGSYCSSGSGLQQVAANVNTPSTMNAYFANWALLMHEIGSFGKPVLVIVEPDTWGFLQNASRGTDNAATVPASVSSSGYSDAAGFPNTVQGFVWALLHIRDKYAHNAILALHASTWAPAVDIATDTRLSLDVGGAAQKLANFLNSAGLYGNPAGVSSWDLLSNDMTGSNWDRYNHTFPNFARYLIFMGDLSQDTHRRIILWQTPMGNQYFDTMNNSPGHDQDNRAEYILGNVSSFAAAGIIGVLFGGGTSPIDAMHDGITNPAPISTYECNFCNNHKSIYPDDDGGYLRIFIGQYMRHPVPV